MSSLPSLTPRKVIKALKKGFVLDTRGAIKFFITQKQKEELLSHFTKKDLPKGMLLEILKQAGIDKKEFKNFL